MARKVVYQQTDRGLVPEFAKGAVPVSEVVYDQENQATWRLLLARQQDLLPQVACKDYLGCFAQLSLGSAIPTFAELNGQIQPRTGWAIVPVAGLLSDTDFFAHLGRREFPVTWWIRPQDQIDYISEPDFFHDLIGHVPMLMVPQYGRLLEAFSAVAATLEGDAEFDLLIKALARLYWFTVEFGLVRDGAGPRVFGAGILSSPGECRFSLSPAAWHRPFDVDTILRTPYQIDRFQDQYFVAPSLEGIAQIVTTVTPARLRQAVRAGDLPAAPDSPLRRDS